MNTSNSRLRNRSLFALLLLAVSCCGCLKGDVFEFITYDRATDTFRYLQLDLHIAGESPSDIGYLGKLYGERAQIITHPEVFRLFTFPAILRIDAHHCQRINLGAESGSDNPTLATTIPLDAVKVEPGKFFLTKDNTLAYYHVVTVGGAVVDQALAMRNQEMFGPSFVGMIDEEIDRRGKGGTIESWGELRQTINKSFDDKQAAADRAAAGKPPEEKPPAPPPAPAANESPNAPKKYFGFPLTVESLTQLRKAAAAGELGFHRHGSVLEIAFPLSAADCREAKTTVDLWKARAIKALQTAPGDFGPALSTMFNAEIDGGRLVMTIDLRLLSKFEESQLASSKPDPKTAANYRDAVAGLRARKIPIDDKLTVRQVIDEFNAKR